MKKVFIFDFDGTFYSGEHKFDNVKQNIDQNRRKFLNKLSNEISGEFPTAKSFSVRNLKNMARFYREYPDIEIVQTLSAQITWRHNLEILRVESKE